MAARWATLGGHARARAKRCRYSCWRSEIKTLCFRGMGILRSVEASTNGTTESSSQAHPDCSFGPNCQKRPVAVNRPKLPCDSWLWGGHGNPKALAADRTASKELSSPDHPATWHFWESRNRVKGRILFIP